MPTNDELDLIVPDSNIGYRDKVNAFLVSKGASKALADNHVTQAVVAWDDTTTVNVVYLKYLSGKIDKVNKVDKTILTAQAGGTWANRATTNVYTEGGV